MGTIYVFWTGENTMISGRRDNLAQLKKVSECDVVLVTLWNLDNYILPEHPLHPAYEYLSETQKSDYLRAYFMHFYGGGYSDVKGTTGSWRNAFNEFEQSDAWVCGYKEILGGASGELADKWSELVGNGAYICKPGTPLTQEWYAEVHAMLDANLEALRLHPANDPRDHAGTGSGYPLAWDAMSCEIFHRICYKYKEKLMQKVPFPVIWLVDLTKGVFKLLHT
jgi:hypothetical protein